MLIRPIRADDKRLLADGLHHLSQTSIQRRFLGSLLADELAQRARMRGIRRFTATMGSDNVPAQRLMEKLTEHLERHHAGQGVSELTADLAA